MSYPFENRHLTVQTIHGDSSESNRSFHSEHSKSSYSLKSDNIQKVRKASYNDIAFPIDTELEIKNTGKNDKSLKHQLTLDSAVKLKAEF